MSDFVTNAAAVVVAIVTTIVSIGTYLLARRHVDAHQASVAMEAHGGLAHGRAHALALEGIVLRWMATRLLATGSGFFAGLATGASIWLVLLGFLLGASMVALMMWYAVVTPYLLAVASAGVAMLLVGGIWLVRQVIVWRSTEADCARRITQHAKFLIGRASMVMRQHHREEQRRTRDKHP